MTENKLEPVTKWRVVSLALEMGFIIAIPIVVFGLLGKYVDQQLGTKAVFKIVGLLLAITATTIWMTRRFAEIFKAMSKKDDKQDKNIK